MRCQGPKVGMKTNEDEGEGQCGANLVNWTRGCGVKGGQGSGQWLHDAGSYK